MSVPREGRGATLLVLVTVGGRRFAWRGHDVEGILPMAQLTPLPGAGVGVAGILNLHGKALVVVDPRPELRLAATPPHPDHHLLILTAVTRFLVWVDRADAIVYADEAAFDALSVDVFAGAGAAVVVRLEGAVIPILEPPRFDPGRLVRQPSVEAAA